MAMILSTRGILFLSAAFVTCASWEVLREEFFIRNRNTQKCIDVDGNPGVTDWTNVQLWDCEFFKSGTDQLWNMDRANRLVSLASGKCLDVLGNAASDNGVNLMIYSCESHGGTDHIWEFDFHDATYFRIKNVATGKCLDVDGDANTANGANIQQWDCESFCRANSDQWWEVVPKDSLPNVHSCPPH